MAQQNGDTDQPDQAAAIAQALRELNRGEATAAALENHLDSLEKKIQALLDDAERVIDTSDSNADLRPNSTESSVIPKEAVSTEKDGGKEEMKSDIKERNKA